MDAAPTTLTFDMPGGFDAWWEGTGLIQSGDYGDDAALKVLHDAYKAAKRITRTRGYTMRLTLPRERDVFEDRKSDKILEEL
jgi:hypothetical protein